MAFQIQTRRHWDELTELRAMLRAGGAFTMTEEQSQISAITKNAEWLLTRLYVPDEHGRAFNRNQTEIPGLEQESINWGDLFVSDCEKSGDHWHLTLEEADPSSTILCEYVRWWLELWGWPCRVAAEW